MSPLFTSIVIVMGLLAVMGIVVGVANDAVNFLNSALGSKVAPRRVILWIAAAGILIGTVEEFELNETRTAYTVRVRLAAEMSRLNEVVLVGNRDFYEIRNLQQSEQIEQHTRND